MYDVWCTMFNLLIISTGFLFTAMSHTVTLNLKL